MSSPLSTLSSTRLILLHFNRLITNQLFLPCQLDVCADGARFLLGHGREDRNQHFAARCQSVDVLILEVYATPRSRSSQMYCRASTVLRANRLILLTRIFLIFPARQSSIMRMKSVPSFLEMLIAR